MSAREAQRTNIQRCVKARMWVTLTSGSFWCHCLTRLLFPAFAAVHTFIALKAVGIAVSAVPASSAFCFACRALVWSCRVTNTRGQQEVRHRAHHGDLRRQTLPFLSVWCCQCWCFGSRSDPPLLYLGTCARTSSSPADKQHVSFYAAMAE